MIEEMEGFHKAFYRELFRAADLHPRLCDLCNVDQFNGFQPHEKALLERTRSINDGLESQGRVSATDLLIEEIYEALEAVVLKRWDAAMTEYAQVAVVAARAYQFCEMMKARKAGGSK